jgi:hypothetical protein
MLDKKQKNSALSAKKMSVWVHKCFRSRKSEGEYWTVYKALADDEIKFYQNFWVFTHQFNNLLQKIENDFIKKSTTFREATSPVEKLVTCGQ